MGRNKPKTDKKCILTIFIEFIAPGPNNINVISDIVSELISVFMIL